MFPNRLSRHAALFFGYRHLDYDYDYDYDYENDSDRFAYDVSQTGPVVALRLFW
ncbi:MAG: hypothetical protein GY906_38365 [bacterium]|nr:hypothetical protein [bacterium]